MRKRLGGMIADARGATAIEYGLIVALVVIAMLVGIDAVGGSTASIWQNNADRVGAVMN